MSENYFYSSLSGQEIEDTLLGSVRFDKGQQLSNAQMARARQNIGAGSENTGFQILGYYDTLQDLIDSLQVLPQAGDAYGIGTEPPYHIYVYDGATDTWLDNGTLNIDAIIDDNDVGLNDTWSSQKISDEIAALIDDTDTAADTTWSSNKISSELSGKATPADVAALVDDSTTSASKTWSSQKIASEIDKLKWKLVWTNPNPSSNFDPKTISLDLSAYSEVKIPFLRDKSSDLISSVANCIIGYPYRTATINLVNINGMLGRRIVRATTTGVVFETGAYYGNYNSTNTGANDIIIPYQIYAR